MGAPIHLHPTTDLAERVLLPGDPGRALHLAQELLESPLMFNHNRGLWGYTGTAADGEPLTIQSTGMGAPSAAIVVHELIDLGARRLVRVGTCGALTPALSLGELVAVSSATGADGVSAVLGARDPHPALTAALEAEHRGPVVTSDVFYDPDVERQERWVADGALAVEMECAAVFAVAGAEGAAAAAVLLVTDVVLPQRRRIGPEELRAGETRLGLAGLGALQRV
jgi:DeoD family purine-nucleoside phosphorylase